MIRLVTSDDPGFKSLSFTPGLNVILADRTEESSEQQTRNGAGKSSFVRLIHFLLGGSTNKKSFFQKEALAEFTFAMSFDLGDQPVMVARSGSSPNANLVNYSPTESDLQSPFHGFEADEPLPAGWKQFGVTEWRRRLAAACFGLSDDLPKHSPTFRSLISYLVRREDDGGFHEPFKQSYIQQAWDAQVAISYFFGLDWTIPAEFKAVRDEEKSLAALRKAAKEGSLGDVLGTAAELRTELAVTRQDARVIRQRAAEFQVVDRYEEYQREANELTRRLRELRDEDAIDRDLLSDLQAAAETEAPPGADELDRLWEQVNIVMPDEVRTAYDDVRRFHESVIANRRTYLSREADLAQTRVADRRNERESLDARRAAVMQLLSSGGALEQFSALQAEVGRRAGQVEQLERQYELAENFETGKARAENRRRELLLRLQEDYHDRADRLDEAISLFEEYSRTLYEERQGSLVVKETIRGPEFDVEITGRGSVGINSMQVLCLDFAVVTLLSRRGTGPGFLVHDSHIFDGVDERQRASALMLGAQLADELGFQYIVTLNTDMIPQFPDDFDFGHYVSNVKFTDETKDGGLFGFRFD